jgi:phosphoenolpyruvate carboxykinase (GTP)
MTTNAKVLAWLDEMTKMCRPDQVVWIDGSKEQLDALRNVK